MRQTYTIASAAIAALALAACSSTQAPADGRSEVKTHRVTGEVSTLLPAGLDTVHEQALRVVQDDLQLRVEKNNKDAMVGVIAARTADEKLITITLTRKADAITHVNTSAGPFNDDLCKRVIEKLQARVH